MKYADRRPTTPDARAAGRRQSGVLRQSPSRTACLIALLAALAAPAFAQPATTAPDDRPTVSAAPGFDGRWTVGHWAPLTLTFRDPGTVRRVELFCPDAGPTFRTSQIPDPAGVSRLDLLVYAQSPSIRWTVRLTDSAGGSRDLPLDLGVDFRGATPGEGELRELAAQSLQESHPETFGRPGRRWDVDPDFYEIVWPGESADWSVDDRATPLVALGLVAVLLVLPVFFRRWRRVGLALGVAVLVGGGVALWVWQQSRPTLVNIRLSLTVRAAGPLIHSEIPLPNPALVQTWQCLAARHAGDYKVAVPPLARVVVGQVGERPGVVLSADADRTNATADVTLVRGGRRALVETRVQTIGGAALLSPAHDQLAFGDMPPLTDAWLVTDTRAARLGEVAGGGNVPIVADAWVRWADQYMPAPDAARDEQLRRRLLRYWSTRTLRGGRVWLVGWSPDDAGRPTLNLHAIDLGPIAAPTTSPAE